MTAELDELGAEVAEVNDAPVIKSVNTDDGFHQIRQDSLSHLVIGGSRLETTTSVTVGAIAAEIESVASDEVRVSLVTPPGLIGRSDVSVVTDAGTATRAEAVQVTPWVLSPTGTETGHGTYESPVNLCFFAIGEEIPRPGDTLQFLAGTHRCSGFLSLNPSITIEGAGRDETFVAEGDTGSLIFDLNAGFDPSVLTTTIRDISFQHSVPTGIHGSLVVERVADSAGFELRGGDHTTVDHYTYEGVGTAFSITDGNLQIAHSSIHHIGSEGSPGILVTNGGATVDRVSYDGPGTGVQLSRGSLTIANSQFRHCGAGNGILVESTAATLDHVVVEDCGAGARITGMQSGGGFKITNSKFIGNRIGVAIGDGFSTMADSVISGSGAVPETSETGIEISNGALVVTGVTITGQRAVGIALSPHSSREFEASVSLFASAIEIDGGAVGIGFSGSDNSDNMTLNRSTVRGQTLASVVVSGVDASIDLGTPVNPGLNTLSVVSGFALDDQRNITNNLHQFITATGTTLNGMSFDGQTIFGPVALAPFYRVNNAAGGIQF
jgi:hypothetical protein